MKHNVQVVRAKNAKMTPTKKHISIERQRIKLIKTLTPQKQES